MAQTTRLLESIPGQLDEEPPAGCTVDKDLDGGSLPIAVSDYSRRDGTNSILATIVTPAIPVDPAPAPDFAIRACGRPGRGQADADRQPGNYRRNQERMIVPMQLKPRHRKRRRGYDRMADQLWPPMRLMMRLT